MQWGGQLDPEAIKDHLLAVVNDAAMDHRASKREAGERVLEQAMPIIEQMKEQLDGMRHQLAARYRTKSEKVSSDQLALALVEHLVAGDDPEQSPDEVESTVKAHTRKRKKRVTDLSGLPRVVRDKHPSAVERTCNCGREKAHVGYDTTEHLQYKPASLYVEEERLHKYACSACKDGVTSGQGTPKLIPGSVATPSLLSHTIVSKIFDATPLYRQSTAYKRLGILLSDKTLGEWYAHAADQLALLQPVAKDELLRSGLISFDDTSMPMRNLKHAKNIQRGHVWIYLGDRGRTAYAEFSPDWKGVHPCGVLEGFTGNTQHDGYAGVRKLYRGLSPPRQAGCMDHARRKFVKALESGDNRAAPIILAMRSLYEIESLVDDDGMSDGERLGARQKKSAPLMDEIDRHVTKLASGGKSRSPLAKAVVYWQRQRDALGLFLEYGSVPISNAHVERMIRLVALLRKNALCVGSEDGGHRYATLLTLSLNCILTDVNPSVYFTDILTRIAAGATANELRGLLPAGWQAQQSKN